jgi:hypothetical protein
MVDRPGIIPGILSDSGFLSAADSRTAAWGPGPGTTCIPLVAFLLPVIEVSSTIVDRPFNLLRAAVARTGFY